jgi:hypothetical protein
MCVHLRTRASVNIAMGADADQSDARRRGAAYITSHTRTYTHIPYTHTTHKTVDIAIGASEDQSDARRRGAVYLAFLATPVSPPATEAALRKMDKLSSPGENGGVDGGVEMQLSSESFGSGVRVRVNLYVFVFLYT